MTTELRSTRLVVGSEPPANSPELRSTRLVVGSEASKNDPLLRSVRLVVGSEWVEPPTPLIAVRASETQGQASAVTTHPIGVPTGTQDDDVLIAFLATKGQTAHTGPGGWTQQVSHAGTYNRSSIWSKVASSEPSSYDWTSSSAYTSAGFMLALSSAVDEIYLSSVAEGLDAEPISDLLAVPDVDDGGWFWLTLGSWRDDDATVSAFPTDWDTSTGSLVSGGGTNNGAGAGWAARVNHERAQTPRPFTLSESEGWLAWTLAVRGAVASGGGGGGDTRGRFGLGLPSLGIN